MENHYLNPTSDLPTSHSQIPQLIERIPALQAELHMDTQSNTETNRRQPTTYPTRLNEVYSYWSDDTEDDYEDEETIYSSPLLITPIPHDDDDDDEETPTDTEIPEAEQCNLCDSQISIQFRSCKHAACKGCTKKLWYSMVKNNCRQPAWFPCPWCRARVCEVGVLLRQPLLPWCGDKVVFGEVVFTVWKWYGLGCWVGIEARRAVNMVGVRRAGVVPTVASETGVLVLWSGSELEPLLNRRN